MTERRPSSRPAAATSAVPPLKRRGAVAVFLCAACAAGAGCRGWAVLHLAPMDQTRILETEPLILELRAAECCYSIDDERITIALADENTSLTGALGKKSLLASIVLDGLPADRSRDYRLDRNSVRGKLRNGASHVRFASLSGILALWLEPDGRARGRLRTVVKQQRFNVLLGWTGNRRVLLVGDFVAVRDGERTAALVRRSEADGLERAARLRDYGRPRAVTGPPIRPPGPGNDGGPS